MIGISPQVAALLRQTLPFRVELVELDVHAGSGWADVIRWATTLSSVTGLPVGFRFNGRRFRLSLALDDLPNPQNTTSYAAYPVVRLELQEGGA